MNIYQIPIMAIKQTTPRELRTRITAPPRFVLGDDRQWPVGANALLDSAMTTQAPLLPKFKGFKKISPCELIAKIYADVLIFKAIIDAIGEPQSQHEADLICRVSYKAYLQCIYAAWLCVELKAKIETTQDKDTLNLTVYLCGFTANQGQGNIYELFYKTWTDRGVAVFSNLGRTFKDALDMVSNSMPVNPVITAAQALFRSIHGLVIDGKGNASAYSNDKRADNRTRAWYMSRSQGAFLLLKLIVEFLTKGISGLESTKPARGISIAKHDNIKDLKRSMIAAIESGNLPVSVFALQDKAQALFNNDPFDEFRFWNTFDGLMDDTGGDE